MSFAYSNVLLGKAATYKGYYSAVQTEDAKLDVPIGNGDYFTGAQGCKPLHKTIVFHSPRILFNCDDIRQMLVADASPPLKKLDTRAILPLGTPFYEFMRTTEGGKACFDIDQKERIHLATLEEVREARNNFDPKVYKDVMGLFKNGEAGFKELLDGLNNCIPVDNASDCKRPAYAPEMINGAIARVLSNKKLLLRPDEVGLSAFKIAPLLLLASGAGTLIVIDDANYYYNVCYEPGSSDPKENAKDVKSGRSFGAGPVHEALDATDRFYLRELDDYLKTGEADPRAFGEALLKMLTRSDADGWKSLSNLGQQLATDFLAIYTAELDRNLMNPIHRWQNDLAEVTFLSIYGSKAGKVAIETPPKSRKFEFVDGTPAVYFGVGKKGSGIGIMRKARRALQTAVTAAMREINPKVVSALEEAIGAKPGGDVIHNLMLYLNDPAKQESVKHNAEKVTKAAVAFFVAIRENADKITTFIQKHMANGLPLDHLSPESVKTGTKERKGVVAPFRLLPE